jgi:hypothetical protein
MGYTDILGVYNAPYYFNVGRLGAPRGAIAGARCDFSLDGGVVRLWSTTTEGACDVFAYLVSDDFNFILVSRHL